MRPTLDTAPKKPTAALLALALEDAFDWDSTQEGMEYWLGVFDALQRVGEQGA